MPTEDTPSDVWRELAAAIVARRRQLGFFGQQDLADAAEVSLSTVTRLESGKPLVRRSRTWPLVEKALEWPPGYIEAFVLRASQKAGFLIEVSELSEIEPQAREAIHGALMATLPDATVAQVRAAEAAAIKALREKGLIPSDE